MNKIKNLNKSDLIQMKSEIERQLKEIEDDENNTIKRKDSVKYKTKINELTPNDRMFGIGLSSNNLDVYFMDYCDVRKYNNRADSDYDDISIGHRTKPFGISTSIHRDRAEKHYFLSLDTMRGGYDQFYTLFPETWEEDFKEALQYRIHLQKKYNKKESDVLRLKGKSILKAKKNINKYLSDKKII